MSLGCLIMLSMLLLMIAICFLSALMSADSINFTDLLSIRTSIDLAVVNNAFLSSKESPKENKFFIGPLRTCCTTTLVKAFTYNRTISYFPAQRIVWEGIGKEIPGCNYLKRDSSLVDDGFVEFGIELEQTLSNLSLIHICRCRRYAVCRSRWSPYH
eukprot:TRINITY_DN3070_c0_g1_i9.p1 TRINITY_DN3070_c0_g1~~TRINITY_DN3070_c0_g1_i9.p1  ORF type:complete len:157 (-),score=2.94 TRINITY_DN3070_c0_g1_i9:22-492(-)